MNQISTSLPINPSYTKQRIECIPPLLLYYTKQYKGLLQSITPLTSPSPSPLLTPYFPLCHTKQSLKGIDFEEFGWIYYLSSNPSFHQFIVPNNLYTLNPYPSPSPSTNPLYQIEYKSYLR